MSPGHRSLRRALAATLASLLALAPAASAAAEGATEGATRALAATVAVAWLSPALGLGARCDPGAPWRGAVATIPEPPVAGSAAVGRARLRRLGDPGRTPGVATVHHRASAARGRADRQGAADGGRWRPALVASIGLAAVGAAAAYWNTDRADVAYQRYLHSAGAGRQQRSLDRAEHHDRLAGAGFLLMEAGLGLTTWFVFF